LRLGDLDAPRLQTGVQCGSGVRVRVPSDWDRIRAVPMRTRLASTITNVCFCRVDVLPLPFGPLDFLLCNRLSLLLKSIGALLARAFRLAPNFRNNHSRPWVPHPVRSRRSPPTFSTQALSLSDRRAGDSGNSPSIKQQRTANGHVGLRVEPLEDRLRIASSGLTQ